MSKAACASQVDEGECVSVDQDGNVLVEERSTVGRLHGLIRCSLSSLTDTIEVPVTSDSLLYDEDKLLKFANGDDSALQFAKAAVRHQKVCNFQCQGPPFVLEGQLTGDNRLYFVRVLFLDNQDVDISASHCSCMLRATSFCKHMAALLYYYHTKELATKSASNSDSSKESLGQAQMGSEGSSATSTESRQQSQQPLTSIISTSDESTPRRRALPNWMRGRGKRGSGEANQEKSKSPEKKVTGKKRGRSPKAVNRKSPKLTLEQGIVTREMPALFSDAVHKSKEPPVSHHQDSDSTPMDTVTVDTDEDNDGENDDDDEELRSMLLGLANEDKIEEMKHEKSPTRKKTKKRVKKRKDSSGEWQPGDDVVHRRRKPTSPRTTSPRATSPRATSPRATSPRTSTRPTSPIATHLDGEYWQVESTSPRRAKGNARVRLFLDLTEAIDSDNDYAPQKRDSPRKKNPKPEPEEVIDDESSQEAHTSSGKEESSQRSQNSSSSSLRPGDSFNNVQQTTEPSQSLTVDSSLSLDDSQMPMDELVQIHRAPSGSKKRTTGIKKKASDKTPSIAAFFQSSQKSHTKGQGLALKSITSKPATSKPLPPLSDVNTYAVDSTYSSCTIDSFMSLDYFPLHSFYIDFHSTRPSTAKPALTLPSLNRSENATPSPKRMSLRERLKNGGVL